jgi:type IV pilus assembly protein PilC
MPYFHCRLATEAGELVTQTYLAPSSPDCRKHFEAEGYCILSIKRDWKRIQVPALPFAKKIKDKEFIMFNQELVALIKAGYPILKSIEIILLRVKNIHFKELLMRVEDEIRAGKSLSEAFSAQGSVFSTVYIASLMAGERSGNLAETIRRFIDYQRTLTRTRSQTAMTYPSLLLVSSFVLLGILLTFVIFVLLGILLTFVIPRFADFYTGFDEELPAITRALVSFSTAVKRNIFVILGLIAAVIATVFQLKRREHTRIWLDWLKLRIPYARAVWIESGVALFSRTLSLLLSGGISLLSSIGIASRAVPNSYLRSRLKNLADMIKNGESLSDSLAQAGFITPLALDMIRIGETSANLEGMLGEISEVYNERIQSRIDTFVSLLTPVIIIFMGLVVAVMLFSVYFPIFNIIQVTR